jgi:hypothetical protein
MKELLKNHPVMSVVDSVKGLLNEIDNSTRETCGGQFVTVDGARLNW